MSPIYVADGKILISGDGKLASLPCPTGCCGREPPGVCCSGIWYDDPTAGVCCSGTNAPNGIWVPSDLSVENGVCCGGEWYPPSVPGECCGGVWYPGDPPQCPEGQVYLTWGSGGSVCCGCVSEQINAWDPDTNQTILVNTKDVKDDLCCPLCTGGPLLPVDPATGNNTGCLGRCCNNCNCAPGYAADCYSSGGQWFNGCCEALGCPQSCCGEDDDCNVTCETIDSGICDSPRVLGECGVSCPDACLGACCIDGEYTEQTTQAACNGCWSGPGSTTCTGACVNDGECCENKISKGILATFSKPPAKWNRCKNCSTLQPETLRVTVTGTTDSAILIHGTPFGADGARCSINHSFLICWENFNIEPVPCGSNFRYLDVTVCWATEATDTETLDFSGCNGLDVWLGACAYGCVTTLSYSRGGHTSNAHIQLYGDGIIEANGTGPLVLNRPIAVTVPNSCVETLTLTLTGTNTQNNEISGAIQDSTISGLGVIKTGSGVWKLSGASSYSKQLEVESGILVIGANVSDNNNASPFGTGQGRNGRPIVGTGNGYAALLLSPGITVQRGFTVPAGVGVVAIGGYGAGAKSIFANGISVRLARDVTLQASTGGSVEFANAWHDDSGDPFDAPPYTNASVAFTIGSIGNEGTVILGSDLPDTATSVVLAAGTVQVNNSLRIAPQTPFTIQTGTFDKNGFDQYTDNLTITGTATLVGNGNFGVDLSLSGGGNIINSEGTLIIGQVNGDPCINTLTGSISILGGSVIVNKEALVSGSVNKLTEATFTNSNIVINFSTDPNSGDQFRLFAGPTVQSYGSENIVLYGTSKTAIYNSSNSTLTIN